MLWNKKSSSKTEELAALLDAMIDEELDRPEEEQDIRAVAEWSEMLEKITSGAYNPGWKEKQALLRSMRSHTRTGGADTEKRTPSRRRRLAVPAAALAVLLLTGTVYAGKENGWLDRFLLKRKSQINALEDGESLTFHEGNRDITIFKGDAFRYDTVQDLANGRGIPVLWPAWLPEGIETGTIDMVLTPEYFRVTLIPYSNGFKFYFLDMEKTNVFPERIMTTVCGKTVEFRYYLEPDVRYGETSGVGCFVYGGTTYYLGFRNLDEAQTFLASLYEVKPDQID